MTNAAAGILAAVVALGVATPRPQELMDLSGVWVLQEPVGTVLESVVAASESITVEAATVTLVRGTHPASTERYQVDDTERAVSRARGVARACRAVWQPPHLVITCVQPDRGPGGRAAPIVTREVRSVDSKGRLVVESLWRSGTRESTERRLYVRQPQQDAPCE